MDTMLYWIFRIFLTVKLFISCDGHCEETSETSPHFEPAHHDEFGQYVYGHETWVVTNIKVDCWKVDLPLTWTKKQSINYYACGDCKQTLTISSSNISVVPALAFRGFSNITTLRINNVHLKRLQPGSFNSLHSLKQLYLTENEQIVVVPGIFNSLVNLEILDLSRNLIREIGAESLTGMIHLKQLNLSSNRLIGFESSILDQNIIQLENIDLSFNLLSNVEINTDSMNIESVDLSSNSISELHFCPFDLLVFNISKNYITFLGTLNCSLSSFRIVHLDVSNNNISKLDTSIFSNLVNLEYLNLQYNNISSIPTGFFFSDMDNLTNLNLSHNELRQFQHGTFGNLGNLFTLDVSYNEITSLKRFLHPLDSLRNLYIQENEIHFLNGDQLLEDLPELSSISLENNDFSCNDLLEIIHRFRKRNVDVISGKSRNTTNIHGIYCSDNRDVNIFSSDKTIDVNSELEEIILTKLQQLANGDLKKSVINDYFNNEFKNSNFYKYLENFHDVNLPKFNETAIFNYFNRDFGNSNFYKYMESLRDNENFTIEFNKNVFRYFDSDFKNSNFVKYLNELKKAGDDMTNSFSDSGMKNYLDSDFRKSNLFKFLETIRNFECCNSSNLEKLSGITYDHNNRGLLTAIVILLFAMILLKITFFYIYFRNKDQGKTESVELLEA